MIRKFKALGLALVAVFAMSAVVASAAQATPGTLTAEGKQATVTGVQVGEHEFALTDHLIGGVPAGTKCKKAHFHGVGNITDGATTVTITPTYNECTAFGLNATISHEECHYLLHLGTKTTAGTGWHVNTTVQCPAGKAIRIVTATCEVTVGSQENLVTSEVTNSGSAGTAMDLLLHTNITGIKYTVTKDGIGCPLSGTGSFSKGDYNGTTTVTAHDALKNPVGITVH